MLLMLSKIVLPYMLYCILGVAYYLVCFRAFIILSMLCVYHMGRG